MAKENTIPDYTEFLNDFLESKDSQLGQFKYTDEIEFDSQFPVDDFGVITGGITRTNRSPTRVEMNSVDNALYVYQDGEVRVALNADGVYFFTPSGVGSGAIVGFGTNELMFIADAGSSNIIFNASTFSADTDDALDLGTDTELWKTTYTYVLGLKDGMTAPSAITDIAQIYVDTADGDLKVKFGDGTVKTIVTDT